MIFLERRRWRGCGPTLEDQATRPDEGRLHVLWNLFGLAPTHAAQLVSPSGTSQAPQLRQTVTPPARGLSFTGLLQFGHGTSVCPSIATPSFRPDIGPTVSMPCSTL